MSSGDDFFERDHDMSAGSRASLDTTSAVSSASHHTTLPFGTAEPLTSQPGVVVANSTNITKEIYNMAEGETKRFAQDQVAVARHRGRFLIYDFRNQGARIWRDGQLYFFNQTKVIRATNKQIVSTGWFELKGGDIVALGSETFRILSDHVFNLLDTSQAPLRIPFIPDLESAMVLLEPSQQSFFESCRPVKKDYLDISLGPAHYLRSYPTILEDIEIFLAQTMCKYAGKLEMLMSPANNIIIKFTEENTGQTFYLEPEDILSIRKRKIQLDSPKYGWVKTRTPQYLDKSINLSLRGRMVLLDYEDPRLQNFLLTHFFDLRQNISRKKISKWQAAQQALEFIRDHVTYDDERVKNNIPVRLYSLSEFLHKGVCNERGMLLQVVLQFLGIESEHEKGWVNLPFITIRHTWVKITDLEVLLELGPDCSICLLDPQQLTPRFEYKFNDHPIFPDKDSSHVILALPSILPGVT